MNVALIATALGAAIVYGPIAPPASSQSTALEVIRAEFGKSARIMTAIARCESGLRQHNDVGGPVENPTTHDIGLFQINPIHFNEFAKLGISIYTLEGNVRAAKVLFEQSHLAPWRASLECWGPALDGDLAAAE